jgi:plasmid stabilization system protein ParE
MRVVRLPKALADLVETADHIAEDNIVAADRFFDSFEKAVERIRRTPKMGAVKLFEGRLEVRMWPIKGFEKCLIFYTESSNEIVILRIVHSARHYTRFFDEGKS